MCEQCLSNCVVHILAFRYFLEPIKTLLCLGFFFFLDTDRALVLLEEYCKKLRKPEEQQLKKAIRKVMGIFKSSLFQALLGRY